MYIYCIVIEEHLTEGKQVLWIKYCIQGFLVGDNTVTVLLVKLRGNKPDEIESILD